MENLERIYDRAFFTEWGISHAKYIRSAEIIASELQAMYHFKRLVDLGCGCGVYSHEFSRKGVSVLALDGVLPPADHAYPISVHAQDLTLPFENRWGVFDAALCLEVAEHIPEEFLEIFLKNITQFGERLILSAAPPGQGGHHHVNEQPKRYWVGALAQAGFAYSRKETGRLFERLNTIKLPYMWMGAHISIYNKSPHPETMRSDLPFAVRMDGRHLQHARNIDRVSLNDE